MDAVGIIFSNIHDASLSELTRVRTIASVPFAGRYRFVDFALSNMVNSGITNIGIITKNNYQSLMDHVGTGKEWDLARKSGGLRIIPPFGVKDSLLYSSRLEALKGCMSFLNKASGEYVVMTDCDNVCNISYDDVLKFHTEHGADITCVYKDAIMTTAEMKQAVIIKSDSDGNMTDIQHFPNTSGKVKLTMNMWLMKKELLRTLVLDAIAHGYTSFTKDIIRPLLKKLKICAFKFTGYYGLMNSLSNYYRISMDVLTSDVQEELFSTKNRAVYTKVKDSAPTKYGENAHIRNSFISDGCIIEGVIENSILSRGVRVGRGAVVKNCILMQETFIGAGASINAVITDKNVMLRDKLVLSGCAELPFFVDKGRIL